VLLGAAWQRCRVHFMRSVLAVVPKGNQEMVAAAMRKPSSPSPTPSTSVNSSRSIAAMLGRPLPKGEAMLDFRDVVP
jgi:putative transposase